MVTGFSQRRFPARNRLPFPEIRGEELIGISIRLRHLIPRFAICDPSLLLPLRRLTSWCARANVIVRLGALIFTSAKLLVLSALRFRQHPASGDRCCFSLWRRSRPYHCPWL